MNQTQKRGLDKKEAEVVNRTQKPEHTAIRIRNQ
jgi:hypothetical protein